MPSNSHWQRRCGSGAELLPGASLRHQTAASASSLNSRRQNIIIIYSWHAGGGQFQTSTHGQDRNRVPAAPHREAHSFYYRHASVRPPPQPPHDPHVRGWSPPCRAFPASAPPRG